jgi:DNA-directed RNA polymerase specialized sigma24 family protein
MKFRPIVLFLFLALVAHRRADIVLARRNKRKEMSIEAMLEAGQEPVAVPETRGIDSLIGVIGELPSMRRIVFCLREIYGVADQVIAERLGITATTVRRHDSLAVATLLRTLKGTQCTAAPAVYTGSAPTRPGVIS